MNHKTLFTLLLVHFALFGHVAQPNLPVEDLPDAPTIETILSISSGLEQEEYFHPQRLGPEHKTSQRHKKYNVSICAIIKNETKYLKEWIEFHRLVGVEHFYLYSNDITPALLEALKPYHRKGLVTLINWINFSNQINEDQPEHWALSTQIPAYENAIQFRGVKATKWLALLDTDEYLVPVRCFTIKDQLKEYDSYPAIVLETDVFDGSHENFSPAAQMLIESRNWIKPPASNILKSFTKLILKPDLCTGFTWPPYNIVFKNNQKPMFLNRSDLRINRYVNRDRPFLDNAKHKLYVNSRFMPREALSELLEQGYAIEDEEQAISRYLPDLRKQCIGDSL